MVVACVYRLSEMILAHYWSALRRVCLKARE